MKSSIALLSSINEKIRDNQIAALPLILDSQDDVVISAATAAGKTEAAFLPLLTHLWQGQSVGLNARQSTDENASASPQGVILYVAPVKALINDQVESPESKWHISKMGLGSAG
jgi:ATP-dependent Lhr-like helicase